MNSEDRAHAQKLARQYLKLADTYVADPQIAAYKIDAEFLSEALRAAKKRIEELEIPRSGYEEMNARHMADIENLAYENKQLRERERGLREALEHIAFSAEAASRMPQQPRFDADQRDSRFMQVSHVARGALSDTEGER